MIALADGQCDVTVGGREASHAWSFIISCHLPPKANFGVSDYYFRHSLRSQLAHLITGSLHWPAALWSLSTVTAK